MAYNKTNMRASTGYVSYSNDKVHQNSSFHLSNLPSSSTAPSDLPGFLCPLETHHQELHPHFIYDYTLPQGSHTVPIQFPLSPPPTNSDPKRSVPLPSLGSNAEAGPSSPRRSPNSVALNSGLITPPLTLSTATLDLPADVELSPIPTEHDGWNASLLSLPSASNSPEENNAMGHLLSPISPEWTTKRLFPSSDSYSYLHESHDNDTSPHCRRSILSHLDIPYHLSPSESMWHGSPPSWMDDEDELDMLATPSTIDMDMPSTPTSLPSSPFAHELDFNKPDHQLFENDFARYYLEPPVHDFEFLPELDDIPDSPSSPSLRSFSTLPALDEEDDFDDRPMSTSPPSPGASLLSLPGADTDDFLIPQDSSSEPWISPFGSSSSSSSSSSSLLLLEDEGIPRSPSPDNYDVDITSIEDCADPDICRLSELRKRSHNTERATRQLEQTFLEQGAVHQRWEARRTWKKEKERGREIGAMLRLKLAQEKSRVEGVETEGEREGMKSMKKRKGMVTSMEQLVAKMMLRRNETYRSLADRKTPLTSKFHTSSPLVRHDALFPSETDDGYPSADESWTPAAWMTSLPQSSLTSL